MIVGRHKPKQTGEFILLVRRIFTFRSDDKGQESNSRASVYRHLIWIYCLIGIVTLPVLWLYGPKLTLAILPAPTEVVEVTRPAVVAGGTEEMIFQESSSENQIPQPQPSVVSNNVLPPAQPFPTSTLLAAIWLGGILFMLARLSIAWIVISLDLSVFITKIIEMDKDL